MVESGVKIPSCIKENVGLAVLCRIFSAEGEKGKKILLQKREVDSLIETNVGLNVSHGSPWIQEKAVVSD